MWRRRALPVVLALGLAAGCASTSHPSPAFPPAGSDARTVLAAYLRALKAGDCRTAARLTTAAFAADGELCGHLKVRSYTDPGEPALPGDGEAIFSTELRVTGTDVSLHDGKNTWFYVLRQQTDGEWLLVGGGTGP